METIDTIFTWQGLIAIVVFLILIYYTFKLIVIVIERFGKKNLFNRKLVTVIKKGLIIFKPVAISLVLLDFISLNYLIHSLFLIILGVFGYNHIKNYIHGIFLSVNPLINEGAVLNFQEFKGEIKKLLTFGLILNTSNGERFINYVAITNQGFTINSNDNQLLRQTLFLKTDISKETLLDILFDNPLFNFNEKPSIKTLETNRIKQLQYTLETGATNEDLIAFFQHKNIITSITKETLI